MAAPQPVDRPDAEPELVARLAKRLDDVAASAAPPESFDLDQFRVEQAEAVARTSPAHRRWLARLGPFLRARTRRVGLEGS